MSTKAFSCLVVSLAYFFVLSCSTIDNNALKASSADSISLPLPKNCYVYDKTTTHSLHKARSYYLFANTSLNNFIDSSRVRYEVLVSKYKLDLASRTIPMLLVAVIDISELPSDGTAKEFLTALKRKMAYNRINYDSLVDEEITFESFRFSALLYGLEIEGQRLLQEVSVLKKDHSLIVCVKNFVYADDHAYLDSILSPEFVAKVTNLK